MFEYFDFHSGATLSGSGTESDGGHVSSIQKITTSQTYSTTRKTNLKESKEEQSSAITKKSQRLYRFE
jgi:hypothetical protein